MSDDELHALSPRDLVNYLVSLPDPELEQVMVRMGWKYPRAFGADQKKVPVSVSEYLKKRGLSITPVPPPAPNQYSFHSSHLLAHLGVPIPRDWLRDAMGILPEKKEPPEDEEPPPEPTVVVG